MFIDPICRLLGGWAFELTFPSIVLRFAVAAAASTIIGCERSGKRHSAGLRTFILVTLAATTAMLIDQCAAALYQSHHYLISTAVVISIGIVCVSSILYTSRNQVKGLTTAFALWTCGIIGLSAGAALFTVTVIAFLLTLVCLSLLQPVETWLKNRSNHFEIHLELKSSQYLQEFATTIRRLGLLIDDIELNPAYSNSGLSVYSVSLTIRSAELKKYKSHREIIEALASMEYVSYIEEMRR